MKLLVAIGCILFFQNTNRAIAADLNIDTLEALIRAKSIQSIEELLPLLPDEMRSHYVLMYQSRSLQQASFASPRTIVETADARLICAFNGDATQSHFDDLECIQYRDEGRNFEFHNISFPSPRNQLKQPVFSVGHNQSGNQCASCHGKDPRPNWDPYNVWPGAYASNDPKGIDEATPFRDFRNSYPDHPRYKYLQDVAKISVGQEHHNVELTDSAEELNTLRIQRLAHSAPHFDLIKYAVLGSIRCSSEDFAEKFLPLRMRAGAPAFYGLNETPVAGKKIAFFWLFNLDGLDTRYWSTRISAEDIAANKNFPGPFTTSSQRVGGVPAAIFGDDPDLASFGPRDCDALGQKSISELEKFEQF